MRRRVGGKQMIDDTHININLSSRTVVDLCTLDMASEWLDYALTEVARQTWLTHPALREVTATQAWYDS